MYHKKVMSRKETRLEVQTYIDRLKYSISTGSVKLQLVKNRKVDVGRDPRFTNGFTLASLFPDEDYVEAIKRELAILKIEEYIETVKDINRPQNSDMRVFGRIYSEEDVYIKIRVELVSMAHANGENYIMVMSFHYSDKKFVKEDFPYRRTGDC